MIDLDNAFSYKPATEAQRAKYEALRNETKKLAVTFRKECAPCPELDTALLNLEQSLFWANASIARN